jgi:DNA-directed RNA polymerase specialized sigma24 family protein
MKYQRDMSDNEIAIELDKNVGAIEMGLTRARRLLKDFVSKIPSTDL